jgi:hypothetical protein
MNDQRKVAEERRVAEERLKNAVQRLGAVSSGRLGQLIKGVEDDVSSSVRVISHEVVSGIQDIKAELSVASAVRRRPLPWLAGAAVVGVTVGVALGRAESGDARPASRWHVLLVEAGLALLKAARADGDTK